MGGPFSGEVSEGVQLCCVQAALVSRSAAFCKFELRLSLLLTATSGAPMARTISILGTGRATGGVTPGAPVVVMGGKHCSANKLGAPGEKSEKGSRASGRATGGNQITSAEKAAVRAFLKYIDTEFGTTRFAFGVWRAAYDDLRSEHCWPELSDKVLGLALQQCGCRAKTIDERRGGKGRYRVYTFEGTR